MELKPLHPDFGVEVRGASLLDVVCRQDAYAGVRAAFEAHSLLLWRDQQLSDELQATFSRAFGPLELTKVGSVGAGTFYVVLTNIGPEGRLVAPNHRQALAAKANQLWHTDSTFKAVPALASVLTARQVPTIGGETEFVSTRAAWRRLPQAQRTRLSGLTAVHNYLFSRRRIDPDLVTQAELDALPSVRWRMAWRNPVNGQESLYVASHLGAIDGMADDEALALAGQLIDEATRPEHVYTHRWRAGDVLLWDNRATLHRGRPWPMDEPRTMTRTTISAVDADGLASVRPAMADTADRSAAASA